MCASDLMVEDALGPQTNETVVSITLTEDQLKLIAEVAGFGLDPVNLRDVMSYAVTKELQRVVGNSKAVFYETQRIELNNTHLVDPVAGDLWSAGRLSAYRADDFRVMKRLAENDIVVWLPHLRTETDPGFRRVTRQWMSGHAHFDSGMECRITDLNSKGWLMNCRPMTEDHAQYTELTEYNKTCDYADTPFI